MAGRARLVLAFGLAVALAAAAGFHERRMLVLRLYALVSGGPPVLLEPADAALGVAWLDDYFTVEWIDDATVAIGEPRYPQGNFNYLLLGSERALLFDSGPGLRDIRPVVEEFTALPVTAVPSHLHYDHIGNHRFFERVAVIDLPHLRERAPDGLLTPTPAEHLGFVEGHAIHPLRVSEWLAPGSLVDLGGREVRVLHAPGHTPESIVLLDEVRGQLFAGDYLTQGALYAFVPGSSLRDYLATADALLGRLAPGTALFGAHRVAPFAETLSRRDLADLQGTLRGIRDGSARGSGLYPRVFRINQRLELWTDLEWTERWD